MSKLVLFIALIVFATSCSWREFMIAANAPQPALLSGDPVRGEDIFRHGLDDAPPCLTCHQVGEGGFGFALGPNMVGISERGGTRIEGMDADDYIVDSILHPHHFVVPGYRDIMYPDFAEHFNDQDLADLIAYLMTL